MALTDGDIVWVSVGCVVGGTILIVAFCFIIYKLCRNGHDVKKKHVPTYRPAGIKQGYHPKQPLPLGIWTTNPGLYADTPSNAYAQTRGKPLVHPHAYQTGLMERTFSEPVLARVPFHRRTVRRVQSMVKHIPAVFHVRQAPGKYNHVPATRQHWNNHHVDVIRREHEVKQTQMTINDDVGSTHSSSKNRNSSNVVARAYSDFKDRRDTVSKSEHVAKAFNSYTKDSNSPSHNPTQEKISSSQIHISTEPRDAVLYAKSDLELHKVANSQYRKDHNSRQVHRAQSNLEGGHRGYVQLNKREVVPPQGRYVTRAASASNGKVVLGSRLLSSHNSDPRVPYGGHYMRARLPPNQKHTQSLDRKKQPNHKNHHHRHSAEVKLSARRKKNQKEALIAKKDDPVRNNFILKKKANGQSSKPIAQRQNGAEAAKNKTGYINGGFSANNQQGQQMKPARAPVHVSVPQHVQSTNHYYYGSGETLDSNRMTVEAVIEMQDEVEEAAPSPRSPSSLHSYRQADSDIDGLSVKGEKVTANAFAFLDVYDDSKSIVGFGTPSS